MNLIFIEETLLLKPKFFRFSEDTEAEMKIDISCKGDETNITFKKNKVCNGYCMVSELKIALEVSSST